jgi:hypothetical protein
MRIIRTVERRKHSVIYGRRWRTFREGWLKAVDIRDAGEQIDAMLERQFCATCGAQRDPRFNWAFLIALPPTTKGCESGT